MPANPSSPTPEAHRADTSGDQDFASALVAVDKTSRSWREKLAGVEKLLARAWPDPALATEDRTQAAREQLIDVAIYLRFLAAGEIACAEDGRHFRPGHHAQIALQIQERLAAFCTPELASIARKIYPSLPSSAQSFRRAEPLTRIRDIAHRNDIPSELKREIKESLQNKLHRCAGPEDLATSARLLERISAPGATYAAAFVEQFRIFHGELEEFFNARSLDQQLKDLRSVAQGSEADGIDAFLRQKSIPQDPMATLDRLTKLRRSIAPRLERGSISQPHDFLLADIALEDFAFALLSEIINALEGGKTSAGKPLEAVQNPEATRVSDEGFWTAALQAFQLALANLSGVSHDECRALVNESRTWAQTFAAEDREQCLRLKATVERARRMVEFHTDRVMALFPKEAEKLGLDLRVAQHAIRVFGEGEIRRHLVFQVSKLVSLLLTRLRHALGGQGLDTVVSGQAIGRLKSVVSLEQLGLQLSEPVVALLKTAQGDEEIPAGVAGIVLAHEIPHLSHLGVRARQAGVVLVAADTPEAIAPLRELQEQVVVLNAGPETIRWEILNEPAAADRNRAELSGSQSALRRPQDTLHRQAGGLLPLPFARGEGWGEGSVPVVYPVVCSVITTASKPRTPQHHLPDSLVLPLSQVVAETGGPKAFGTRRLAELSLQSGAGFTTPPALVIPFGVMERALEAVPDLEKQYQQTMARLDDLSPDEFMSAVSTLSRLLHQLSVPQKLLAELARHFGKDARLMVRSSSNCEDLETSAGAGLYESVPNVPFNGIESAVRTVWASLWTPRAALNRRQAGIPHQDARMAVLIQRMLAPDYSFVLHTVHPITADPRQVYLELAVGLGETLVSAAARGTPYRLVCDKETGEATIAAYANFSQSLQAAPDGGAVPQVIDYSQIQLSCEPAARNTLARRLVGVARFLEAAFQKALDIEGVVVGNELYLVQARPQQGLHRTTTSQPTAPRAEFRPTRSHTPKSIETTVSPSTAQVAEPPMVLGLFEKRIEGDDSLLRLAQLRFEQFGLGPEVHGGTAEQLEAVLRFRPTSAALPIVHLPRDFRLPDHAACVRIQELASRFAGRIQGLLLHDDGLARQRDASVQAARELNSRLQRINSSPLLFVEYAVGLEPQQFYGFFESIRELKHVTACIDVGHVGIRTARAAFEAAHPGQDVCALKSQPQKLPGLMDDIQAATAAGLPAVLDLVARLGALGKPLHFHLHDGQPLSTFSPFGVSDHLSFLAEIPLDFEYRGRRTVPLMFGPSGLRQIVAQALGSHASGRTSFTLEIHPTNNRLSLNDTGNLFAHWTDKTNAELMNHWLWVLGQNRDLLVEAIQKALAPA